MTYPGEIVPSRIETFQTSHGNIPSEPYFHHMSPDPEHPLPIDPAPPKYVIFKIDDWEEMLDRMGDDKVKLPFPLLALMDRAIDDGVVLRRQEFFSAPALYAYANSIVVAIKAIKSDQGGYNEAMVQRLQKIADYFMWEGDKATEEGHKIPD